MASQGVKKTAASKTDATKALEAEATGGKINVEFRGEALTIDPEVLDDYELMDQLNKGFPQMALAELVPDGEQRSRLIGSCDKNRAGRPKLSSVLEMVGEIAGQVGAGK